MSNFPGFDNIKMCYEWGCYTIADLVDYVKMNCLTKDEFKEISGTDFPEE